MKNACWFSLFKNCKENNKRKLEDQGKSNYAEERLLQSINHFKSSRTFRFTSRKSMEYCKQSNF